MRRKKSMRFFKIHKAFTCAFCRIPASRFARCPWVYLYEVRGRWAWGLSAMPTAAQAASAPLMPFCRFFPPKRRAEGAAAVSPRLCREAAANHRAEIHRSAFAIRAVCESGAFPLRLCAVIRRSLSRREALRDDVSQAALSARLSEKNIGCGDFSPHPWGTNG